jgi:TPR repeat protein
MCPSSPTRSFSNAATARGPDDAALRTAGPADESSLHRHFQLTPPQDPLVISSDWRTSMHIGAWLVAFFLVLSYWSVQPSSWTPPRDIRAELRARCGDLGPLRCRLKSECDRADANGCYELGIVQEVGNGGPIDVAEAAKNYEKACQLRSADACRTLANLHRSGYGVQKDLRRANELALEACRLGLQSACTPGT